MKFIIFTQDQKDLIKGNYGKYSGLDPIKVYRNKYLAGISIPGTEVEEWALPIEVLQAEDLKQIKGFLQCFPIYEADYRIKYEDEYGDIVTQLI
ncbi:MAG: hypothetical protein ACYDEX_19140 [Mobilitalea sp.]